MGIIIRAFSSCSIEATIDACCYGPKCKVSAARGRLARQKTVVYACLPRVADLASSTVPVMNHSEFACTCKHILIYLFIHSPTLCELWHSLRYADSHSMLVTAAGEK